MRFGLQRNDGFYGADEKVIRRALIGRSELFYRWPFRKGYVVFIGGNNLIGMLFRGFLDQLEEGRFFFFAVDNEGTTKDFMAAMPMSR